MLSDRRSLAVQLRDELRDLLVSDELRPGDRLPTESELGERYRVGRTTVREALKLLEQDGLIHARRGLGRFVAVGPGFQRPLSRLEGVTDMLASRGFTPASTVLDVAVREATAEEAEALRLAPRTEVIQLERARSHASEVLVYSVDVFPRRLVAEPVDSIDWTGSLFAILEQRGHPVAYATAGISAAHLPAGVARRLGLPRSSPWLVMAQDHHDPDGAPLLRSTDYHRGERFRFDLVRRRDG